MSVDVKAILLKRVDFRVDLKGLLLEDVLKGVLEPALQKSAADPANKIDDAMVALLMPVLEDALVKLINDGLAKLSS